MKGLKFGHSLLLALCLPVAFINTQTQSTQAALTNVEVVKLVKAGFKEKSILAIISSRPARFDLSTDRIIELKRTGVSEKVILAMMARQEGSDFSDEAWSDESFSDSGPLLNNPSAPANNNGSTVDIFGSSGGNKGSTKTRGGGGSSSDDVITTGTATVRILRPPSEAGANPKLEKRSALTNDSIIELVEAGFSEGTIIRRIEQSSVEFNLSPEKMAELRRHRVTDKILDAMKSAMGVDEKGSNTRSDNVTPKQ